MLLLPTSLDSEHQAGGPTLQQAWGMHLVVAGQVGAVLGRQHREGIVHRAQVAVIPLRQQAVHRAAGVRMVAVQAAGCPGALGCSGQVLQLHCSSSLLGGGAVACKAVFQVLNPHVQLSGRGPRLKHRACRYTPYCINKGG